MRQPVSVPTSRSTARQPALPGLDVVEHLADHPRALQIEALGARRLAQHAGRGLAAQAGRRRTRRRRMRAGVEAGQPDAGLLGDARGDCPLQPGELGACEATGGEARLVRDHDEGIAGLVEALQRFQGAGRKAQTLRIERRLQVQREGLLLPDEYGAARRSRARVGQVVG